MSSDESLPYAEYKGLGSHGLPGIGTELSLQPGMTAVDYALVIIGQQGQWTGRRDAEHMRLGTVQTFVNIVNAGFEILIEQRPLDEVDDAKRVLMEYTASLKVPNDNSPAYTHYNSWINKVRKLARYTRQGRPEDRVYRDRGDNTSFSSDQFWQDVYGAVDLGTQSRFAHEAYIVGPDIEQKGSDILSGIVDQLQELPVTEVFKDSPSVKSTDKLVSLTYDMFLRLVSEASEAGWKNARITSVLLGKLPKRNEPLHAVINTLGNQVTELLNRYAMQPGERPLDKLHVHDLKNTGEAINRCAFFIFEVGASPEGHDPLNYKLTSQILAKLADEASNLLSGYRRS